MGTRLRRSRSRKLRRDETVSDRRVCGLLIGNRWAAGAPTLWAAMLLVAPEVRFLGNFAPENFENCLIRQNWLGFLDSIYVFARNFW